MFRSRILVLRSNNLSQIKHYNKKMKLTGKFLDSTAFEEEPLDLTQDDLSLSKAPQVEGK